jgi:hypothetical protein
MSELPNTESTEQAEEHIAALDSEIADNRFQN